MPGRQGKRVSGQSKEQGMNNRDMELILELKKKSSPDLNKHLRRLVVFGSRAKGEASEDSDLDVLVLVDEKTSEIEQGFEDIAYQVMWDHDFKPIISLKIFEYSKYVECIKRGFSFYKNIESEGVVV
jgi:predicted nucleotidyltransferase